jgi:hypothetical protein
MFCPILPGKLVAVADLDFTGNRPRVDDLALTLYFTDEEMQLAHAADRPAEERIATLRPLVRAYAAALSTPERSGAAGLAMGAGPAAAMGDRQMGAEVTVGRAGERACPCDRRCGRRATTVAAEANRWLAGLRGSTAA